MEDEVAVAPPVPAKDGPPDGAKFLLKVAAGWAVIAAVVLAFTGGAVVAYEGGDVAWLTLEQLGLSSDDEKTVGPESKSPVLRVLRYGDGSVR